MKKRIIYSLVVCGIFGLILNIQFSETTKTITTFKTEYAENDQVSTTLPEAVNGVITLQSDVTLGEMYLVAAGENITIDFNNYKIDASNVNYAFNVEGTLTIKGTGEVTGRCAYVFGGELLIDSSANITATKRVVGAYNGPTVTINEGATIITTGADATILAMGAQNNYGGDYAYSTNNKPATLNVSGNVINTGGSYAICGNGTDSVMGADITIEEKSTISSPNGIAIYIPNKGAFTVNGGTITGATAVYIRSGDVVIENGKFDSSGEKNDYDPSKIASTGHAITIDSQNYPSGNPTIKVLGGTFISTNNTSIGVYTSSSDITPVSAFIYNGLFSSELDPNYFNNETGNILESHSDGLYAFELPHSENLTFVDEINPTCITEGNIAYYKCQYDYYYEDSKGQNEIINKDEVITEKTGIHTYGEWIITKESTPISTGIKERTCSVCNHIETATVPVTINNPETSNNTLVILIILLCMIVASFLLIKKVPINENES